jgi:predicted secreted protein
MTMALNAYSGYSCLLQEEIAAVYTTIAAVRDLAGPTVAVTAVDTSTRDARARSFLPAMYDSGEITFDIVYDPDTDTHSDTVAGGLRKLQKDQTVCNWKLVLPDNGPVVVETVKGTGIVDEIQTVTVRSGGTNVWTFGANSTAALAWDISTADLQTALQALVSIGAGNCTVAGTAGLTYTLTFVGTKAKTDVAAVVVTATPRTATFAAFVTNFSLKTPMDDGMTADLTLKVTGAVTWA